MNEKSETSLERRVTLGVIVATVTGLSALFLKTSAQTIMNKFMKTETPLLNGNEGGVILALGVTSGAIAGSFAENILRPKSAETPEPKVNEVATRENLKVSPAIEVRQ